MRNILSGMALAVGAVLAAGQSAGAALISDLSVSPSGISAGGAADLQLSFSITPDSGYYSAYFTGGTGTFYSGDGQSDPFSVVAGSDSQLLQTSFAYAAAGTYEVEFVGTLEFAQQKYEHRIVGTRSFRCGLFRWCSRPVWALVAVTDNGSVDVAGSKELIVAAPVPEPLSAGLLATGILGLAGLGRRTRFRADA